MLNFDELDSNLLKIAIPIIAIFPWIGLILGGIMLLLAINYKEGLLFILSIGIIFSALVTVLLIQIARALINSADYLKDIKFLLISNIGRVEKPSSEVNDEEIFDEDTFDEVSDEEIKKALEKWRPPNG